MPIRILSLPVADLQYALNCMDTWDLVAFSLCSKRTKNLVKFTVRKIKKIEANVYDCRICLTVQAFQTIQNFVFIGIHDSCITLDFGKGTELWRKQGFTQRNWIPHFLDIFHESKIHSLVIMNVRLWDMDTVKQCIPKCQTLRIRENCYIKFENIEFLQLCSIAENAEIEKNIFTNENHISKFLNLNLRSVHLSDWDNPFKLELNDLLTANSINITIQTANIRENELNRYLKLWMKGNNIFNRPSYMKLSLIHEIDRDEVLRGIKYQIVDNECSLNRADGKKLSISIQRNSVDFEFQ
ncbi:hypothetical protein B9Z55_021610 [Caenorhabditis nigoni]|uniref:F-box domain-containing protein n=1 Tax=Caenorhabditis nigoni TaxID=1611254 RepID=A0A2G5TSU0_9PELO|nr:hypothetical protein B9Z55_021610 [Caenorhabditis nigoni]